MASAPSEPRPVLGRLDKVGRLVAADPDLEALQRQAGSGLGQELALMPKSTSIFRVSNVNQPVQADPIRLYSKIASTMDAMITYR